MDPAKKEGKGPTRRQFVKVAAAGAAALGTAALPAGAVAQATPANQETDVLVIGLGFAGLCTVARALEKGAKVIAIEKQPKGWWTPGGNLLIAGGSIHIASQSLKAPKDKIRDALMANTGGMIPPDVRDAMTDNAARSFDWIVEKGAQFAPAEGLEQTLIPQMPPPVWGRIKPGGKQDAKDRGAKLLVTEMEKFITDKGGTMLYETKALELLADANGEVVGARVRGKDGPFEIKAKAVVLSTGGYELNREMLLKYVGPRADEVVVYTHPGCTGDGFTMVEKFGAALRSMNYLAFSHYYSADCYWKPDLVGAYLEAPGKLGIIVDQLGHRFFDETLGTRIEGPLVTKISVVLKKWIIIDDAMYQKTKAAIDDVKEFGGTVHTAATIPELAEAAGIGPRLAMTVAEYNKAIDDGKATELAVPRAANAAKIATAPFYAIPFVPGIVATYGGVLVSPKAEVLDRDNRPIPGLYAAGLFMEGSLSGGVENPAGAYGGCLSACLIFGLLAAENAVTRIVKV